MTADRYRSAVTGEYVSEEFAMRHPETTLKETASEVIAQLERRVAELEAEVAALRGQA